MNYEQFDHGEKQIYLVDMRRERTYPYSELVHKGMTKFCREGKRVGILVAKKGYASGMVCEDCGHIPRCEMCDIAIAYHKDDAGSYFGLCHICKRHYPADACCQQCQGHAVDMYGVGAQQVEQFIKETYYVPTFQLVSEQVNSWRKIEKAKQQVEKTQVIIGTSLLTTPLGGKSLDALVVLQADSGLHIPDMNANWQSFCRLYSLFTSHHAKHIIVQTYNPEHYAIRAACNLDESGFREQELMKRKEHGYPPFTDMCVLLYKHEVEKRMYTTVHKLYQEILFLLETYEMKQIEVYPTPPLIYKKYGKYRYNIVMKGSGLREFMDIMYSKLKVSSRGFKVDWEPMNMM